jgi:hypothetical protein
MSPKQHIRCFPATSGWDQPIQADPPEPISREISAERDPGDTARVTSFAFLTGAGGAAVG